MAENLTDTNVGNIEYISRQAAIDVAREDGKKIPTVAIRIMHDIKVIPAADVVPVVHGEWIRESWHSRTVRKCSNCHVSQTVTVYDNGEEEKVQYKYCPYCGAKMNGGETDG